MTACNDALRHKKRIDLFECARVDYNTPIEDTIQTLKALRDQGLFDHIGVSEVSAETLRRANSIYPITIVEIEVSPWSMEEETKKGKRNLVRQSGLTHMLFTSPRHGRRVERYCRRIRVRPSFIVVSHHC